MPAEKEEKDYREDGDVHQQEDPRVEGADDDVENYPGDEEPAGPVAAVEHEDASDDLQNACEMDVPVASKIITTHHTAQERYGAE